MTFDSIRYSSLKDEIIQKADLLNSSDLKYLIHEYATYINSKRRCSLINTYADLISVLEKRGCISSQDVRLLHPIVNRIGDPQLLSLASQMSAPEAVASVPNDNYSLQSSLHTHKADGDRAYHIIPESVLELVSEEIGNKWREFGRYLGLKEYLLNQIEAKCQNDLKGRAYECLLKFQDRDQHEADLKLLEALKKVRRNDLRKEVEKKLLRRC